MTTLFENQRFAEIQYAADLFFDAQVKYQQFLEQRLGRSEQNSLLSPQIQTAVQRVLGQRHPALMLVGPNSAGKSSLANCFLSYKLEKPVRLCPSRSGHASKRVCCFSFSELDQSRITFTKLVKDGPIQPLSNTLDISLVGMTIDEIAKRLNGLLDDAPNPETDEFQEWVMTITKVYYPFELLKTFDLYDVPGTSESDNPVVQNMLPVFWDKVRPFSLFIYANPALSDDERACLKKLQHAIPPDADEPESSSMFFISTKFEPGSIRNDYSIVDNGEDDIPRSIIRKEIASRYANLPRCDLLKHFNFPENVDDCQIFAAVDSLQVIQKRGRDANLFALFGELIDKLSAFVVRSQSLRLESAIKKLMTGVDRFFDHVHTVEADSQDTRDTKLIKDAALNSIKEPQSKVQERVEVLLREFPSKLKATCQSEEIRSKAALKAEHLSLSAYDGRRLTGIISEATGAFKNSFFPWIQSEILEPLLIDLITSVRSFENQAIKSLVQVDTNDFAVEEFTAQFSATNDGSSSADRANLSITKRLLIFSSIFAPLFNLVKGITSNEVVDKAFKQAQAMRMLDALAHTTITPQFRQMIENSAMDFFNKLSKEVEFHYDQELQRGKLTPADQKLLSKLRRHFGLAEVSLVAGLNSIRFPAPVLLPESVEYVSYGHVYLGTWCDRSVRVKTKSNDASDPVHERKFMDEVHYSRKLNSRQQSLQRRENQAGGDAHSLFPPFLGLYLVNNKWLLLTEPYLMSLDQYLIKNFAHLSLENALRMSLTLAKGIHELHQLGRTHGELTSKKLFVRPISSPFAQVEIALDDFGASFAYDDSGAENYQSRASDIIALGCLIYEIYPKRAYSVLLPKGEPHQLDEQLIGPLRDLVYKCVFQSIDRPTSVYVASELENLLNQVQRGQLAQDRFHPSETTLLLSPSSSPSLLSISSLSSSLSSLSQSAPTTVPIQATTLTEAEVEPVVMELVNTSTTESVSSTVDEPAPVKPSLSPTRAHSSSLPPLPSSPTVSLSPPPLTAEKAETAETDSTQSIDERKNKATRPRASSNVSPSPSPEKLVKPPRPTTVYIPRPDVPPKPETSTTKPKPPIPANKPVLPNKPAVPAHKPVIPAKQDTTQPPT